MRFPLALFLLGTTIPGNAGASSLIVLEPVRGVIGPSMTALGAASAPEEYRSIAEGGSVVVIDAAPPVSQETLSSIGAGSTAAQEGRATTPMVIRGGIIGDVFTAAARPALTQPAAGQSRSPGPGQTDASMPSEPEPELR